MSLIVYKGYAAKVDFDASRVCLAGRITGIEQDIFFYGKTLEEIQSEFHKAVEVYISSLSEIGLPIESKSTPSEDKR